MKFNAGLFSSFFDNTFSFHTFAAQIRKMYRKLFKTWAHLALLAANIIYGINYSVAKAVMPDHINPWLSFH